MRIGIGGIMHESNTFLPITTGRRQFMEGSWTHGPDIERVWGQAHHEVGGFIAGCREQGLEMAPTVMAWATPAGPVAGEIVDEVVDEIVAVCRREAVEGLLLALHGAMVTTQHASGDTEVLRRIRHGLGAALPIIVTLDYHANCTPEMAEHANALVGYQTNPHVDQRSRGELAAKLMAQTLRDGARPVTRIVKPPQIITMLGQDTSREPMKSLMKKARALEGRAGMLSVSLMAGFPYADVPDMGPSVIAVADGDAKLAEEAARQLAGEIWNEREALNVVSPGPQEAVQQALAGAIFPAVLVDLGDNVGGGSAADSTILLEELLNQRATGFVVVLYAPAEVKEAERLGVGGTFVGSVGGKIDRLHGEPVAIRGKVRSLHDGKWVETEVRHGGRRDNDQGPTAVIELEGNSKLVLNSLRTPPFSLGQLTSLGIDPRQERILVVKAAVAYKAAYAPIAKRIIEVDTPGATAVNPFRFNYRRIRRPIYPLDAEVRFDD